MLLLDDLHYADATSIELLHYLARGLGRGTQYVLILGTYRADEVDAARGLRTLLASLRRSGLFEELALGRLWRGAVAELARAMLNGPVSSELVGLVEDRTRGVPLFVEALLDAAREHGQVLQISGVWTPAPGASLAIPPSVRDLLSERLQQLDHRERQVLDVLAVGGEATPYGLFRAVSALPDDALVLALQHLRALGLVAHESGQGDVRYALSHPLIQEMAYPELSPVVQRRLHAAFAKELDGQHSQDLERLAYHYRAAGSEANQDRALDVLVAAGDRAYALYANDQAARHFGAALALVRTGRRSELMPTLLERLGVAWERVGETAAAIEVWSEALAEQDQQRDANAIARLRQRLALAEWDRGGFDRAQVHLEAGLATLAATGPSATIADLVHTRVVLLGRLGNLDGASTAANHLASLAEELRSPRARAEAHLAQVGPYAAELDFVGARGAAEQGLRAAEETGELVLVQRAHDLLALVAFALGEHAQAGQQARLSVAIARRLGAPTLELYPRNRLVAVDLQAGRWHEALRRSAEVVALARRLGAARGTAGALSLRALVHIYRGEFDGAAVCIEQAHGAFGGGQRVDRNIFSQVETAEMMLALEQGDAERTLEIAKRHDQAAASAGFALLAMSLTAEASIAVGQPEAAMATAEVLCSHAPADNPYIQGLVCRLEALARRALGDVKQAAHWLDRAVSAFTDAELPFEVARARLERAALAASMGHPDSASPMAQESLAAFRDLGAQRYAKDARRLLRRLGVRPAPVPRARSTTSQLSPRELEVVRLVADDLTNAEIAERLVISPRTVTTHLDRMYTRLGLRSRTALVRYAIEAGLLQRAG